MSDRHVALVAGILYLVGMVAGVLSVAPSVDSNDYLVEAAANRARVRLAACSQLVMGAAYVGAAVALYPLLLEHGEALAIGFLGFRLVAGVLVVATVLLLRLLVLSEEYVESAPAPTGQLLAVGERLRRGRDLINHVGMIFALCLGGALFYSVLFRAELTPRWLSVWGLAGVASALVASLLIVARVSEVRSKAIRGAHASHRPAGGRARDPADHQRPRHGRGRRVPGIGGRRALGGVR